MTVFSKALILNRVKQGTPTQRDFVIKNQKK